MKKRIKVLGHRMCDCIRCFFICLRRKEAVVQGWQVNNSNNKTVCLGRRFLQFGYQLQDFQTGVFTYNKNVLRGGTNMVLYQKIIYIDTIKYKE